MDINQQMRELGPEIEGEPWERKEKSYYAKKLGSLGGKATAKKMTKEQLRERAMKGVEARKAKKSQ